ncbi:MAG: hypothetical protein AAF709_19695 [Pseudomonadota bacterium]
MKRGNGERKIEVHREELPPFGPSDLRLVRTKITSGTTTFTTYGYCGKKMASLAHELEAPIAIGLTYQSYSQLCVDHGDSVTYGILGEAGLLLLSDAKRARLREELFEASNPRMHGRLLELLARHEETGAYDSALTAYWAECKADHLSDLWLAAMARYALDVEGDEYSFGYLTSLLDARRSHEIDALRGKATQEAASQGGKRRKASLASATLNTLLEMKRYRERGKSVVDAARFAHKNGFGKNERSNRAAWYRHHQKLD